MGQCQEPKAEELVTGRTTLKSVQRIQWQEDGLALPGFRVGTDWLSSRCQGPWGAETERAFPLDMDLAGCL